MYATQKNKALQDVLKWISVSIDLVSVLKASSEIYTYLTSNIVKKIFMIRPEIIIVYHVSILDSLTIILKLAKTRLYFEKTSDRKCVTRKSDTVSGVATFFVSGPIFRYQELSIFTFNFGGYILTYVPSFLILNDSRL